MHIPLIFIRKAGGAPAGGAAALPGACWGLEDLFGLDWVDLESCAGEAARAAAADFAREARELLGLAQGRTPDSFVLDLAAAERRLSSPVLAGAASAFQPICLCRGPEICPGAAEAYESLAQMLLRAGDRLDGAELEAFAAADSHW